MAATTCHRHLSVMSPSYPEMRPLETFGKLSLPSLGNSVAFGPLLISGQYLRRHKGMSCSGPARRACTCVCVGQACACVCVCACCPDNLSLPCQVHLRREACVGTMLELIPLKSAVIALRACFSVGVRVWHALDCLIDNYY